jgi:hypothetical protein
MADPDLERLRPDIDAATRGGNWEQRMDDEGPPEAATLGEALYWTQIYAEILVMEEAVLDRITKLMKKQSSEARREVELTNVPVVVAQAERFRKRHGYWAARVLELQKKVKDTNHRQQPPGIRPGRTRT